MQVAIIGGGLAGLTAAIEAADRGAAVTLFDARRSLGGRAKTSEHQISGNGGFRLNEGAHALYVGGPAMAMLKRLQLEPSGSAPPLDQAIGIDGPVTGVLPSGLLSLLRTPLLKGHRSRVVAFFARLPWLDPADYAEVTVRDAARELFGPGASARLGEALIRLSAYGHDPDRASADAGLVQLKLANGSGVRYLDRGWQVLVDGLRDRAVAAGVTIRTDAKVTAVRSAQNAQQDDKTQQVRVTTEAGVERFDSVVVASGGPRQAANVLGASVPAAAGWAEQARPARAACLDVGLDVPWDTPGRAGHPTFALGIDQPLYLSVHAPVADLAPPDHSLVHVMRYLHPDTSHPDTRHPDTRHRAECEALLDVVRPGWRDHAVHVGYRPSLVAATDQPSADRGGMAGRPPVAVAGAPGVFLAGDWVGDVGVLVDASVASALKAGQLATTPNGRSQPGPRPTVVATAPGSER